MGGADLRATTGADRERFDPPFRATFLNRCAQLRDMYRASDRVDNAAWIDRLDDACATLDLDEETLSTATDLFLSRAPTTNAGSASPRPEASTPPR